MARKRRRGRGATHLREIGIAEKQVKTLCGECVFCLGKQAAETIPGAGPVKDNAYIFQSPSGGKPDYPVNLRGKIAQYFEIIMTDVNGLYLFYIPKWVDNGMAASAINDIGKTIPNSILNTVTCPES